MNRACIGNPQNGSMPGHTVAYLAVEKPSEIREAARPDFRPKTRHLAQD